MRRVNGCLIAATYAAGAGRGGVTPGSINVDASNPGGDDGGLAGPQHLELSGPISFVHGSEFIATTSHTIVSHGCKKIRA